MVAPPRGLRGDRAHANEPIPSGSAGPGIRSHRGGSSLGAATAAAAGSRSSPRRPPALRETLAAGGAALAGKALVWACKGFEDASGKLPHEVVVEASRGTVFTGALSGPSFALEVARGQPTALVLASREANEAARIAAALNSSRLRIYSNDDLVGVELGGALKNVVAIAAGIGDGLALGRNARAALVTRGLAEISRLGTAMGGRAETFMGLAGLGDLVLTCTGDLSRNREVGVRLAQGAKLADVLASLGHVAEGVHSARAARSHARAHGIEMPITEAVCAVLFSRSAARHPRRCASSSSAIRALSEPPRQ